MKNFKKILGVMVLCSAASSANSASFLGNDGWWYGNVCRTGAYYSVIPFAVIGNTCWNYGWGVYGTVSGY